VVADNGDYNVGGTQQNGRRGHRHHRPVSRTSSPRASQEYYLGLPRAPPIPLYKGESFSNSGNTCQVSVTASRNHQPLDSMARRGCRGAGKWGSSARIVTRLPDTKRSWPHGADPHVAHFLGPLRRAWLAAQGRHLLRAREMKFTGVTNLAELARRDHHRNARGAFGKPGDVN